MDEHRIQRRLQTGYLDEMTRDLEEALGRARTAAEERRSLSIGRDHLDCGSVASPFRETESMKDGSDAVADWALLNCMTNVASGASWVSFHDGGGVGIGYALHAGQVTVVDGSPESGARARAVLRNDPATGLIRHADAGYEEAVRMAKSHGITLPMHGG